MMKASDAQAAGWRAPLLYPWRALGSRGFYFHVLLHMRGCGFKYLLCLSLALATLGAGKLQALCHRWQTLELTQSVSQLPPGYLDATGRLSVNRPEDRFKIIRNSAGQTVFVVNVDDQALSGAEADAWIEFGATAFRVRGAPADRAALPYTSVFEAGTAFDPYQMSMTLDLLLRASWPALWGLVSVWLIAVLLFNALLTGMVALIYLRLVAKIGMSYASAVRLCAFSNTPVAVLLIWGFFFSVSLSFAVVALIPLIYVMVFGREVRRELQRLGPEAFCAKHGLTQVGARTASASGPDRGIFRP